MKVKFWGARGSLPTPLSPTAIEEKIRQALRGAAGLDLANDAAVESYLLRLPPAVRHTIGGNTACVEVRLGQQVLILDAGTGLRVLGLALMKEKFGKGQGEADILISHTHWDHIQGLPFFVPGFIPGNRITFHSPHPDLEKAFVGQQDSLYFPVPLSYLSGKIEFRPLPPETWSQIGAARIYPLRMSHPGECYGYRIEYQDQCLVYATDSEFETKAVTPANIQAHIDFFRDADLLIYDAQYAYSGVLDKETWGHSSPLMGAEFAHRAGVKRLALFHHEPTADDQVIYAGQKQAEAYLARHGSDCQVLVASEGLEVEW